MTVPKDKAVVKGSSKNYVLIPSGLYSTEIVDVELHEEVEGKWGKKDKFYIRMGILDNKAFKDSEQNVHKTRGQTVMHFTSTTFSQGSGSYSNSKLYDFAVAGFGHELDENEGLNVNDLVGKKLRVLIKHFKRADGSTGSGVAEVMEADETTEALESLTKEEIAVIMPEAKEETTEIKSNDVSGNLPGDDGDLDALIADLDLDENTTVTN